MPMFSRFRCEDCGAVFSHKEQVASHECPPVYHGIRPSQMRELITVHPDRLVAYLQSKGWTETFSRSGDGKARFFYHGRRTYKRIPDAKRSAFYNVPSDICADNKFFRNGIVVPMRISADHKRLMDWILSDLQIYEDRWAHEILQDIWDTPMDGEPRPGITCT